MTEDLNSTIEKLRIQYMDGRYQGIHLCALNLVRANVENMAIESNIEDPYCRFYNSYGGLKGFDSLIEKAIRKKIPLEMNTIEQNICDIVRYRIVTPFVDDIYVILERLYRMSGFTVVEVVDYVKNPKPNGYKSLHVVVMVQVCFNCVKYLVKVEIQIRDRGMEYWAETEHLIKYKNATPAPTADKDFKAIAGIIEKASDRIIKLRDYTPPIEEASES